MDLSKLAEPFPLGDIEWRVSRAGTGASGIFCIVLAYITARAIQKRLDDVCGPENWKLEPPLAINGAFGCGISILLPRTKSQANEFDPDTHWVTKWDVSDPTNIEAAKGGFSGAMKRAGAQWGIGRYLYHLTETFAEATTEKRKAKGWHYATLKDGTVYYWKEPSLPAWALPKEEEHAVSDPELQALKQAWRAKFLPDCKAPEQLREGFERFVESVAGSFPIADHTCWTKEALLKCGERIESTVDPEDIDSDVPFE